jgi:hypothetical protein
MRQRTLVAPKRAEFWTSSVQVILKYALRLLGCPPINATPAMSDGLCAIYACEAAITAPCAIRRTTDQTAYKHPMSAPAAVAAAREAGHGPLEASLRTLRASGIIGLCLCKAGPLVAR